MGSRDRRDLLTHTDRAHMVQFYRDVDALVAAVGEYVLAGLVTGEPIVVIAIAEHRTRFLAWLDDRGFDVDRAQAHGWLTVLDAHATLDRFLIDRMPDRARFTSVVGGVLEAVAARHPGRQIRAYGEMVDVLWQDGASRAALALEELWNELAARHAFSLFCGYLMSNFSHDDGVRDLAAVCGLHSHVLPMAGDAAARGRADDRGQPLVWPDGTGPIAGDVQAATVLENARLSEVARAARAEADEANRVKDDFLAMLGHELRNPLSPILTAVQLMKLRDDAGGTREHDIIEHHVRHLVHLVDDLLDVSRITRGTLRLDRRPIRVAALLARAVEIASPGLEERRHRLELIVPGSVSDGIAEEVDASGDAELWVHGDERRLCQVVSNLLTNAAKFTEAPGQITVIAERSDRDVVIRVRDDGIGIAPERLPRVFDLFVRGAAPAQGGLGIGLTLVHRLVAMHGGQVTVHSAGPGHGSEFVVRLPACEPPRELAAGADELRQGDLEVPGRRVLVVDDNQDAAALLGEMLQSLGHDVAIANDGPRALEVVAQFRPELAILDIGLPVMDGYELAGLLRGRLGADVRLVAVTGYGQRRDRTRARDAGFDAHLVKPVPLATLLAEIENLSRRSSSPREPAARTAPA